jgi:alkanesulfonate monooxygenase SsuD/methylene tetrahydromethanopterin reductase-like flavin-dependent oxidoreductase (luciferase family)
MLMIMQNEWEKCRQDIDTFQTMSEQAGFVPKAPIILTNVSCAETREEAHERAQKYLGRKWQSIDDHYHFSDGHLANVKGYEAYGKTAKTYAKLKDPANLKKATDFYVSIQIVGTPDDCLQQLGDLQKVTGHEHLVAEFSFGNLPHHESEKNVRLFADRVLPTLQRDPAFAGPKRAAAAPSSRRAQSDGIFAPA